MLQLKTRIPYEISIRIFAPLFQKHWLWLGTTDKNGYAIIWIGGKTQGVHRYLYKKLVDPSLPDDKDLDHLCRIVACINPECLEPVSTLENVRRGNGTSLSFGQVIEIRNLYKTGKYTHQRLGKIFKVGRSTISMVLCGNNWKDAGIPLSRIVDYNKVGKVSIEKAYTDWRIRKIPAKRLEKRYGVSEITIAKRVKRYEEIMLKQLKERGLVK